MLYHTIASVHTVHQYCVQQYVGRDRRFTDTMPGEINDMIEAESKQYDDRMLHLKTLMEHILSDGALEEKVANEWQHSR
jgi:hypothetical protein